MGIWGRIFGRDPSPVSGAMAGPLTDPNAAAWRDLGWSGGSGSNVKTLPLVTPDTAQRHATVFACCNVIAGDLSKLPLHVYQRDARGREVRVRDHALNDLLNVESSPGVPANVTRLGLLYSYTLRGVAYAAAPRTAGGDVELIEQVSRVEVFKRGRDRFYRFEDGGEVQRTLPGRAMVHLRYMALDGWTHRSPIQVAAESIGLALAGQEAAARTASGDAVKGVAKMGFMSLSDDEEFERQKKRTQNSIREAREKGGILILSSDDDFKSTSISAADMELLASRRFDREQIAAIYRVPPSKLQMLEHGVKANGEQQAIDYKTDCLLHWGKFAETGLAQSLLTAGERSRGLFIRHDYDALMQATTKERYDALRAAVGGPFMTWQEAREIEGLKDLPEGEQPYPPANMTRDENAKGKENA